MHRLKFSANWMLSTAIVGTALSSFNPVMAERISVSVTDLDTVIYELESEPDAIS